jgi:Kef-type K+ transport system membrane component KefB
VRALVVATIGVAVPFVLGTWVLGPVFFGDESSSARLFIGASLVATSIGITASVFRALNITRTRAAQTVLGAAVADDVFGLVILAVVAAIASGEEANARMVAELTLKAFGFLAIAIIVGRLIASPVSRFFRGISGSDGMLLSVAVGFALVFGYLAELFGLEPIIGAFAAGLVLDGVHFLRYDEPLLVREIRSIQTTDESANVRITSVLDRRHHAHVEDLVGTLNHVFVPVFFVYTGMLIDIESLLKPELYLTALIVSAVAIVGKLVSGFAAAGTGTEKLLVGIAMVPRGEVGLIFAATGNGLGVLSDDLFSVIIITIVVSTLIAPPLVRIVANKLKAEEGTIVEQVPA